MRLVVAGYTLRSRREPVSTPAGTRGLIVTTAKPAVRKLPGKLRRGNCRSPAPLRYKPPPTHRGRWEFTPLDPRPTQVRNILLAWRSISTKACFNAGSTCAVGTKARTYLGEEVEAGKPGFTTLREMYSSGRRRAVLLFRSWCQT